MREALACGAMYKTPDPRKKQSPNLACSAPPTCGRAMDGRKGEAPARVMSRRARARTRTAAALSQLSLSLSSSPLRPQVCASAPQARNAARQQAKTHPLLRLLQRHVHEAVQANEDAAVVDARRQAHDDGPPHQRLQKLGRALLRRHGHTGARARNRGGGHPGRTAKKTGRDVVCVLFGGVVALARLRARAARRGALPDAGGRRPSSRDESLTTRRRGACLLTHAHAALLAQGRPCRVNCKPVC